jgi:phage protein D
VIFEGKVDEVRSTGGRGQGRLLHLAAKSADMRGKPKQTQHRHKDKATFKEVAEDWGGKAGLKVKVDAALAAVSRDYWHIGHESFLAWGARMARELGATFKVMGDKAVFVQRSSGASASGRALVDVAATYGDNLIAWDLSPKLGRADFKKFSLRWYDFKEAKWKAQDVEAAGGADAEITGRFRASDADQATRRATSDKSESARDKGGGTVTIDGDPDAQAEASCLVSGVRPGIDGAYRIVSATHKLSRGRGYTTDLDLKQPHGTAGTDKRGAAPAPASGGGPEAGAVASSNVG